MLHSPCAKRSEVERNPCANTHGVFVFDQQTCRTCTCLIVVELPGTRFHVILPSSVRSFCPPSPTLCATCSQQKGSGTYMVNLLGLQQSSPTRGTKSGAPWSVLTSTRRASAYHFSVVHVVYSVQKKTLPGPSVSGLTLTQARANKTEQQIIMIRVRLRMCVFEQDILHACFELRSMHVVG